MHHVLRDAISTLACAFNPFPLTHDSVFASPLLPSADGFACRVIFFYDPFYGVKGGLLTSSQKWQGYNLVALTFAISKDIFKHFFPSPDFAPPVSPLQSSRNVMADDDQAIHLPSERFLSHFTALAFTSSFLYAAALAHITLLLLFRFIFFLSF